MLFVCTRLPAQRGNFELDLDGDEIDDEDDDNANDGQIGLPTSAIRPTGTKVEPL